MQRKSIGEQAFMPVNSQNEEMLKPVPQELRKDQRAITLYGFNPAFGLPSPGPFDMKTEVQLQMMGLNYLKTSGRIDGAPKGKLPYIDDNGTVVADSTLIRFYLEEKYSIDLDHGLSDSQRATAWAAERLVEDNLYWAMVYFRWAVDANFEKGPAHLFDHLPQEIRDAARQKQRAVVLGYLQGQGLGRHTPKEIASIGQRGYWALSQILGEKRFLTGGRPCGADASAFAQIASALSVTFESPIRDAVASHSNLVHYNKRMMEIFFPDFA